MHVCHVCHIFQYLHECGCHAYFKLMSVPTPVIAYAYMHTCCMQVSNHFLQSIFTGFIT